MGNALYDVMQTECSGQWFCFVPTLRILTALRPRVRRVHAPEMGRLNFEASLGHDGAR